MAQTTVPNSPDIAVLDFKLTADLCVGKFFIDLSPSIFIGTGAQNAQGAKVKIVNPFDVEIKSYGPVFDILKAIPAPLSILNSIAQVLIPKVNNNYQYGLFVVTVELTDSTGAKYYATHNIGICEPNPKDKTQRKGTINAQLVGNCVNGTLTVLIDEPPVYKGKAFESKTQTSTLTYPTGSIGTPLVTTLSAFSVPLYEGVHLLKSELCVTYNLGGNNYAKVPYVVNCKNNILCTVDLCCIYDKLAEINLQLGDNCSASKKESLIDVTFDALRLLKTIELGASCGEDVSDYIEQLESLLNCKCSCSANTGTPVVNNTPVKNFAITGCNVVKTTVGLTDNYQIENCDYEIKVNPAASFLTISAPVLTDCVKVQQLDFNVAGLYAAVKAIINTTTEYNYWASIVNQTLNDIPVDLLVCLGLTTEQWNAKTFREKVLTMLTKFCTTPSSTCTATISNNTSTLSGKNTILNWDLGTGAAEPFSVNIFIDNKFQSEVLSPSKSFLLIGFNDGVVHNYKLIAHCSNGAVGNTIAGTFSFTGCPAIPAPSLSSNNVQNATCPFNLNALVTPIAGLSIEWYNSSVQSAGNLVPNPAAVTSGTYFAYQVDVNRCSSPSSQTIIACQTAANCTEPLGLMVERGGANTTSVLITFNSPSNPAPSYLVKRRISSNPDVAGSYTTIGAPVFNASINKYQIVDNGAAVNTLYVYKAESQCTDGGRPSAFYTFAIIPCPALTLSTTTSTITYNFAANTGQVDKFIVTLYDGNSNPLTTKQHLPAFASPVTDIFTGLAPNTVYYVAVKAYIGTFEQSCSQQMVQTAQAAGVTNNWSLQNSKGGTAELKTFSFTIDGVGAGNGTTANAAPNNFVRGYSNLIPVTSKQVIFYNSASLGDTILLNGLASLNSPTGSNNIYTWNNVTGTTLDFEIS